MTHIVGIERAMRDPNLLGRALGDSASWSTWRAVMKAAFGRSLNEDELTRFKLVAGNREPPIGKVRELWAIIGRRGGKSRIAAPIASYIAVCIDHKGKLAAGEQGVVLVLAASMSQAAVVFNYTKAFIEASPVLRKQLDGEPTANEIRLRGGLVIAVHTNSFRTVRGRTLLACVFDEASFWRDETSAQPDVEVYRAALPALATTGGMLIGISSPNRRLGLLYAKHRDYFGKDDRGVLVVKGRTQLFNPTIDSRVIAQRSEMIRRLRWRNGMRSFGLIYRNFLMTIRSTRRLIMVDLWNYRQGTG